MATNSYSSLCDDFYIDMYVNTELDLPTERDTILTFFDRIQRQFPTMGRFSRRDNGEYCLEEDQVSGQYRWVSLKVDRVGSGAVNPPTIEEVHSQNKLILDLMPYMLGVTPLDVDSLDLTYAMDFDCSGNHDEVIMEALFGSSAFGWLLDVPHSRPIVYSPAIVFSLAEDDHTQARVSVESKTSLYEPGEKEPGRDEAITLSLTIRQYPKANERFDPVASLERQVQIVEELMTERILRYFVQPLTEVIAQRRSS
ncbi:MAG TPA: hypothetical protein PKZ07_10920 [Sedimentisphaerales bacterium]|nr:hypothetical protein [Sedimentisphaerales bacterium]